MTDPILIEVTRGRWSKAGTAALSRSRAPSGALALRLGDVERPVYPRSAMKALQALPLIETRRRRSLRLRAGGDRARLRLTRRHRARTPHLAAAMLDRAGLKPRRARLRRACAARRVTAANALIARRRDADAAAQQLLRQARRHAGDGDAPARADARLLGREPSRAAARASRAGRHLRAAARAPTCAASTAARCRTGPCRCRRWRACLPSS